MERVPLNIENCKGKSVWLIVSMFSFTAKENGWTQEQVNRVIKEATKGTYEEMIKVLKPYCCESKKICQKE